jgi:cytochrome P450
VSSGRQISGEFIPAGTVVSTSAYTTCRDPNVFDNPLDYVPERWLEPTPEMTSASRPFSYGPRNCIGKHLAEIGLHLTLSRLFQLYDIRVDPSMTEEMMKQCDRGVTSPWAKKMVVVPTQVAR